MKIRETVNSKALSTGSDGNTFRVRLISEGQGSSGIYTEEMLQRDLSKALPKGTKVFFDHMSEDELDTGLARSMENLVGRFDTDPVVENGSGFANITFYENSPRFNNVPAFIKEAMDDIGVSIEIYEGERNEKGVIESMGYTPMNSLAVVTSPGARGKVMSLVESHRIDKGSGNKNNQEGFDMDKAEVEGIVSEAMKPVLTAIAGLTEALKPKEENTEVAATAVAEAVVKAGLSEVGRKMVYAQIEAGSALDDAIKSVKDHENAIKESLKNENDESSDSGQKFFVQESAGNSNDWTKRADALFGSKKGA